jgi:hypothetical protein
MKDIDITPDNDKREYFRVDDMAFLSYRIVSWVEVRASQKPGSSVPISNLTFKANLDRLSRELQPLHNVIKLSNSNVAQYLSVLDKKINLLTEYLIDDNETDISVEPQEVNIGGGGLSFVAGKAVAVGTMLELTMKLLPEDTIIHSYAKVITNSQVNSVQGKENTRHKVGVKFEFMDEDVRDLITRHVLIREQALLNERSI